jgi:hypothetical protein
MGAAEDVALVRRGYEASTRATWTRSPSSSRRARHGIRRGAARWLATTKAVTPRLPTSASWEGRPEGPSGLSCSSLPFAEVVQHILEAGAGPRPCNRTCPRL